MQQLLAGPSDSKELQQSEPLRYLAARAALTSGGAEIITRMLTIVLSIVTARVLEPREVGLLGLAVIVIGTVSMIGFYPETAAVAARGKGSDRQYAVASTLLRAGIIGLLLLVLWLIFPTVVHYLTGKDEAHSPLLQLLAVLAWMPVLELISCYPLVVMQRRLELSYVARLQILQPVVFVGLSVVLLLTGRGYIGVAWANVTSIAVTAVSLWWRFLWARELSWGSWPSFAAAQEVFRQTGKVFIGGFGGYLGGRV